MKLLCVNDQNNTYLVNEETGEKVENFVIEHYNYNTNARRMSVPGEKDPVYLAGRPTSGLTGSFTDAARMVFKERIFVVCGGLRDFSQYCKEHNIVPSRENGWGEIIDISSADQLRGYRVNKYLITPAAIYNPRFQEIIDLLKIQRTQEVKF